MVGRPSWILNAVLLVACGGSAQQGATEAMSPAPPASAPAPAETSGPPPSSHTGSMTSGGEVKNTAKDAPVLECIKQARDVTGNAGTSWFLRCPAGCKTGAVVWGTDVYTDDSAVCLAAVHAGRLDAERGGTILVTWVKGPVTHVGSTRNGVRTVDYGAWPRSFFVQSVDPFGRVTSPPVSEMPQGTARLSCRMSASSLPGEDETAWGVTCPAGCRDSGRIWGSNPYTGDSAVCRAAIHAGLATDEAGGSFTVTIGGARTAFNGNESNGIRTESYGAYARTFSLSR